MFSCVFACSSSRNCPILLGCYRFLARKERLNLGVSCVVADKVATFVASFWGLSAQTETTAQFRSSQEANQEKLDPRWPTRKLARTAPRTSPSRSTDDKQVGFFRSVEGGGVKADVQTFHIGNQLRPWRQIGVPKYEDVKVQVGNGDVAAILRLDCIVFCGQGCS